MGKDPYPTDATGIPFCKPSWDQQLAENCSGRYVLNSLGCEEEVIREKYKYPNCLFEDLLGCGIVFLNVSYQYIGAKLSREKHLHYLQESYKYNRAVLESASIVLCCGEAKNIRWVMPKTDERFHFIIHPDIRNKVNPGRNVRWKEWWDKDVLYDKFLLSMPFR